MPILRRPPGGARAALVVVLLLLTLAMTGAMAYEAQRAARSHRAAAEGVLRDYAALAAFLYRQNGRTALGRAVSYQLYTFEQVRATADGPLPAVAEARVAPAEACPVCPQLDPPRHRLLTIRPEEPASRGAAEVAERSGWGAGDGAPPVFLEVLRVLRVSA